MRFRSCLAVNNASSTEWFPIVEREEGATPVPCAKVVRHKFIGSWETVDGTGKCAYRIVKVDSFIDDGFEGREDRRKEIYFGAAPSTAR